MIIRNDFVSNSSSSSFIVDDSSNFASVEITKEDLKKAMCFLMNIDEDKADDYFVVLDGAIKEDVDKIESEYKSILDDFSSPLVEVRRNDDGEIIQCYSGSNKYNISKFDSFCEMLELINNITSIHYTVDDNDCEFKVYNRKKDCFEDVDPELRSFITKMVKAAYYKLGIISNYEAISSGLGRFLIHVYDNYLSMISDMSISDSDEIDTHYYKSVFDNIKYKTPDWTLIRFNEILIRAILKIKPNKLLSKKFNSDEFRFDDLVGGCLHEG